MTLDEFEAIRLSHLEDLYQQEAAGRMEVSRATFGRILDAAHRKLAEVLVHGRRLTIEGGPVAEVRPGTVHCPKCDHPRRASAGGSGPANCPRCRLTPE